MVSLRSSWRLLSIGGIDVDLHVSFVLFILLFVLFDPRLVPVLAILFASITAHELTHSFVAKRFGIDVRKIILLPIGGMAVMEESRLKPVNEFSMAVAGPFFNIIIVYLLVAGLSLSGAQTGGAPLLYDFASWNLALEGAIKIPYAALLFSSAVWLNILLAVFNLFVPAIPLDGGRAFRAFLAIAMKDYVKATRVAANVSTVLTFLLFIWAVLSFNIILLLISIFIYFGASAELEYALSSKLLSHLPVGRLARQNFLVVRPGETLSNVLSDMISSRSLVAFVRSNGGFRTASLYDIRHVPKARWSRTPIGAVAVELRPVAADLPVSDVLREMGRAGSDALPVVDAQGRLVGVVFRDDVSSVFEILKVMRA
jgi:Zn-dependent protease/CBS domain-containing protein